MAGPDEVRQRWPLNRVICSRIEFSHPTGLGVPVLYGLPLGHGASLATLPLGVEATVDADALTLTIDEPALLTS